MKFKFISKWYREIFGRKINKYLEAKLMKKFLLKFPITGGNKTNPYVILIDGYTGMEKSTVAKCISKFDVV